MKVKEFDFDLGTIKGGFTFYPYQLTFGISLRYWPDLYMPNIRIHFICFKFWIGFKFKKES